MYPQYLARAPPSTTKSHPVISRAQERCALEEPQLLPLAEGHSVACHFPLPAGAGPRRAAAPAAGAAPPAGTASPDGAAAAAGA
jgi:oligopeptide transport system ATP-binding protein